MVRLKQCWLLIPLICSGCSAAHPRWLSWLPGSDQRSGAIASYAPNGEAGSKLFGSEAGQKTAADIESTAQDVTPARLPPALELPQPAHQPTTLPSAATESNEVGAVVLASGQ